MRSGFKIGQLFGITIRVDWSWLLILVLVTWNLSSVFGQAHGQWSAWQSWGIALLAAILFFASVLAHELAHSLVARARGMRVRNITLFLFGGVSNIQREPPSPRTEFLMATVGPLTSVVLGVILVLVAGLTSGPLPSVIGSPQQAISQLSVGATLLLWLGSINVILGVFNMIPGFPLDGGRVLRSIFWAAIDDLRRATRWASWVGQGIAWLMILAGIAMVFGIRLPFFGTGVVNGLWLAFIGWFLNSSASQSYRQVVIQDVLEGVPVSRMMRTNPPTVSPNSSVDSLVHDYVMQSDDHAFPVSDGSRIVGLVTLEDVRSVARERWNTATIREIMTPVDELVTVTPDKDAGEAMIELSQRNVRQLPVMRNGELAGLLRRQDIVRWLHMQSDLELQ
jgi:Zn-dependent protease/predicted transcriptional regulator